MCGIFALLNSDDDVNMNTLRSEFMKGARRGPEFSKLVHHMGLTLGFHRLAINGLNEASHQPIVYQGVELICNGEIYNYRQIYRSMRVTPTTQSDCEVIIHLYLAYGIEQTLLMLDGVFAFVLLDNRIHKNMVYAARDPFGVRPLYTVQDRVSMMYGFASELKCLERFYNHSLDTSSIQQFPPGTYSVFQQGNEGWRETSKPRPYVLPTFSYSRLFTEEEDPFVEFHRNIAYYFNGAIIKRCETTERPVACLLSGGLDSSLVAALVANHFRKRNQVLETYSIGLAGSEDIQFAKIVAEYIGSNHTEIIVTEDDMFNAIPEVIQAIESYDTTTVRASLGNYLLGKYIASHSEAKVIFNGDGSDELFGGYLYMNSCPDDFEFDKETRRLLKDIYMFDVLRSDKSISSNGLEPRTPFLDRSFVNYVLTIPPYFRNHRNFPGAPEKNLLRRAFHADNFRDIRGGQILPDAILWRRKEAFSDGVSTQGRSLFQILQEKIAQTMSEDVSYKHSKVAGLELDIYDPTIETEKIYYKNTFLECYPHCQHILPYFWMPKYTDATDPSARTLSTYQKKG